MNKLEDFTEGSLWDDGMGYNFKFHSIFEFSFCTMPIFTCDEYHPYIEYDGTDQAPKGTIGIMDEWKHFIKIKSK